MEQLEKFGIFSAYGWILPTTLKLNLLILQA